MRIRLRKVHGSDSLALGDRRREGPLRNANHRSTGIRNCRCRGVSGLRVGLQFRLQGSRSASGRRSLQPRILQLPVRRPVLHQRPLRRCPQRRLRGSRSTSGRRLTPRVEWLLYAPDSAGARELSRNVPQQLEPDVAVESQDRLGMELHRGERARRMFDRHDHAVGAFRRDA